MSVLWGEGTRGPKLFAFSHAPSGDASALEDRQTFWKVAIEA